jgi:hypothetical protein
MRSGEGCCGQVQVDKVDESGRRVSLEKHIKCLRAIQNLFTYVNHTLAFNHKEQDCCGE